MFCYEFHKISKNTFLHRTPTVAVSASIFDLEIIITSALPSICEASISKLFLMELMLILAKITLFKLFCFIIYNVHGAFLANLVPELLDMHSFKNILLSETSHQ